MNTDTPERMKRRSMRLRFRTLLLALSTAGILAACADDDSSNTEEDALPADSGGSDADPNVGLPDTITPDSGTDSGTDAGTDAEMDADAGTDAEIDVDNDTGADADAETDTPTEDTTADIGDWEDRAVLFNDDYRPDLVFAEFGGSVNDLTIDTSVSFAGEASLRIEVPREGYTGGALVAGAPEDLTGYNAVGFWVRADREAQLDVIGMANDAVDAALAIERRTIPLTTEWTWQIVPLANPAGFSSVAGLFHFAEGEDTGGSGYTMWMDDLQYVFDEEIGQGVGAFGGGATSLSAGGTASLAGFVADVPFGDETISVTPTALHFDWMSSDDEVATVDDIGTITAVGAGSASITAMFAGVAARGTFNVDVSGGSGGAGAAPVPNTPAEDVIAAIFSDSYATVPVDTFRTEWSATDFSLVDFAGNEALQYAALDFAGIETTGDNTLDLTSAARVRFDVYSNGATTVRLKIVDFGPNNVFDGPEGDDQEGELVWALDTSPAFVQGEWNTFDVPLSAFASAGLSRRANVAQYIFSALEPGTSTVLIDNFYFYEGDGVVEPPGEVTPAPAPSTPVDDVTASIYSNAYPGVGITSYRTEWSAAVFTEETLADGDTALLYSNLDFVGIETTGENSLDLTAATHVSVDIWSANATQVRFKIVDFGADNVFEGADNTEGELIWDLGGDPAFMQNAWNRFDIPLAAFEAAGLTNRANVSQYIFAAMPVAGANVYIDNFYFYEGDTVVEPPAEVTPAPAPAQDAEDVIAAIYCEAYGNVPVTTYRTEWSAADFTEETLAEGDTALLYSSLDFVGIESTGDDSLDLTSATHVSVDVWSANATQVRFKIVDFGGDNGFQGGDDTEGELIWALDSDPAFVQGEWNRLDIPLSSFVAAGLTNRANVSQFIFAAMPIAGANVYVDNFYFYAQPL